MLFQTAKKAGVIHKNSDLEENKWDAIVKKAKRLENKDLKKASCPALNVFTTE